jgi:hypothetical protein
MGTLGHQDTATPGHWDTAVHCDTASGRFLPYLVTMGRYDCPGTGLTRQPCHAGARSVAFQPASFLRKALGQMPTALGKGRDWVESITKTHSYLEPELLRSLQPVAEMAALHGQNRLKNGLIVQPV